MLRSVHGAWLVLVFCTISNGQMIVAHRGASADAPENTLAAFQLAWQQGADAIEGDFYLTADDQIACIHDKDTKRTCPSHRSLTISESTYEELRTLDVGSWKSPKFSEQRIPLLGDVLQTVPPGKQIFIEVKCGPEIIEPLAQTLKKSSLQDDQITLIAFDPNVISKVAEVLPALRRNWLTSFKKNLISRRWKPSPTSTLAQLKNCGATGLGAKAELAVINSLFVAQMTNNGFSTHCWTVNDIKTALSLQRLGVQSITTDRPAVLKKALFP